MPTFGAGLTTALSYPKAGDVAQTMGPGSLKGYQAGGGIYSQGGIQTLGAVIEFDAGAIATLIAPHQDYTGLTVRSYKKMPNGNWSSEPNHYEYFTGFAGLNSAHPVLEVKDASGAKVWPLAPGTTPKPAPTQVPPPSTPSSPTKPGQGPTISDTLPIVPVPPGYKFPPPFGNPFLTNDDGATWLFNPVNPPALPAITIETVLKVLPFQGDKPPQVLLDWIKYWCTCESINLVSGFVDHFRAVVMRAKTTRWYLEHEMSSSAYIEEMSTLAGYATNGYLALIVSGLRGYRPPEMQYLSTISIKLLADMLELAKAARQAAYGEGYDASIVDYFPNLLRKLAEAADAAMKVVAYPWGEFKSLVDKYADTQVQVWKWIAIGLAGLAVVAGVTAAVIYIPRPRR